MPTEFQTIRNALKGTGGAQVRWEEILSELWPTLSSPLTWDGERLLLEVIRFEGQLPIDLTSEIPHSMPPEDMLKSLAIQALGRWTGLAYLMEMERVQATTQSSSLSSLVRDVIEKTRAEVKPREPEEEVAVSSPEEAKKTTPRRLGKERGMSYLSGRRVRVGSQERELAHC
jgi:hypothetical protein